MKILLTVFVLSLAPQSTLAWDNPQKLPDATASQCQALGKHLVRSSQRKNGSKVRAYCRGAIKPKASS